MKPCKVCGLEVDCQHRYAAIPSEPDMLKDKCQKCGCLGEFKTTEDGVRFFYPTELYELRKLATLASKLVEGGVGLDDIAQKIKHLSTLGLV